MEFEKVKKIVEQKKNNPLALHFKSLQCYNIKYFDKGGIKALILFEYLVSMGKYFSKTSDEPFFHSQPHIAKSTFITVYEQRPILDDFEHNKKIISRSYGGERNTGQFKINTDRIQVQLYQIYNFKAIKDIDELRKYFEF
jgi:hypothetical protein